MTTRNHRSTPEALTKDLEEARKILERSVQTNRNLFITFNSVLVLCLSVTDKILLLGSSTIKLPLLSAELPIWAFASIAPLALVALHFDLLQNLGAHRDKLIDWCDCWFKVHQSPTRNADMPQQLYPFLFDFAWLHANHTGSTAIRARLLPGLCWLLYCWAAYTVLVIFLIRFADLQHYGYTGWHSLLLVFDALNLYWYWPGFTKNSKPAAWKSLHAVVIVTGLFYLMLLLALGLRLYLLLLMLLLARYLISYLRHRQPYWFKQINSMSLLSLSNMAALWTLVLFALVQAHIDLATSSTFIN